MKKQQLTILAVFFVSLLSVRAQSPALEITGTTPSFTQGTINTQILTEVIQEKQQEVKQQVFRNTIVRSFQNTDWTKNLNNFATYHYMYDLMDALTSGKNKTVITSNVFESSSEFAYVMGLVLFMELHTAVSSNSDENSEFTLSEKVFESAMVSYNDGKIETSDRVQYFNLLVDMCYDVVLNNTENTQFEFSDQLSDSSFARWYQTDNVYIKALAAGDDFPLSVTEIESLHDDIEEKYQALMLFKTRIETLITKLSEIKDSGSGVLQTVSSELLDNLETLNSDELKAALNGIINDYGTLLTPKQLTAFNNVSSTLNSNYEGAQELVWYFVNLVKTDFSDFSMTQPQYESMRYVLIRFLTFAKNQFKNDVVSTIIEYLLENTLVSTGSDSESSSSGNTEGGMEARGMVSDAISSAYIYMDVESVISSIYSQFSLDGNKGFRAYVVPFITIGANYASFLNQNTLTTDDAGDATLWNLYYGAEKIGLKWKIWNWEYTHSFDAGQQFEYYGKSRFWTSPPTEPTVSNMYFMGFGSGLLYNLVNLKSDENFSHAIAGAGLGLTFFNGLETNISFGVPVTRNSFDLNNGFINLGFDIPIIEYISAIGGN